MKRITLLAVLALMVAVALPVMATDFTWSGELTYGAITDFTNVVDAYSNANIAVKAAADANNTFNATLNAAYAGGATAPAVAIIGGGSTTLKAFGAYFSVIDFASDIGKALNLPFGLVGTIGWFEPAGTSYSVTGYAYESLIAYDPTGASHDAFQLIATFGPVNVQVAFEPIASSEAKVALAPQITVFDVYGVFGPFKAAVAYTSNLRKDYMGKAGASITWTQAIGDLTPGVNAEFSYNLASGVTNPWTAGIGVNVAYTTFLTLGLSTTATGAGLGNFGINLGLVPVTGIGIDVASSLNLATGAANLLNGVDVSATYKIGASKIRVGYLYETAAGFNYNAPADFPPNGGAYASWDLTF
jgi:hypothetical protein